MKTYYDLLGLAQAAPPDEIKRAFKREIAKYHPDKVQHLGPEFQAIASVRAAELTEAYRVLTDLQARRQYDEGLSEAHPSPAPRAAAQGRSAPPAPPPPADPPVRPAAARVTREQASTTEFVRRAVLARLRQAVDPLGGSARDEPGFDAMFQVKGRKPFFRKPEASVRLLVKVVPQVDRESVEAAWTAAGRTSAPDETTCLMLLGSGMAPARDLAATVSQLRRRMRRGQPLVIPVDVRDWAALIPPETPRSVRSLLDRLRVGG